jgi:CubicO group peptidase (beta-lactamase class C family)
MQLVERGKLRLDEPAEKIDPDLASPPVLTGFDDKGAPQLRTARTPLTLHNLLTHTSGYTYPLWDADVVRYLKCCKSDKKLPRRPLTFDPDAKWAYGGSIDRVGRLVEIASGMPLERYFQDNITGPLGMSDTVVNLAASQRVREAGVHRRNADGSFRLEPPEKPTITTTFLGGGGIYSTAPDYLTLLQAMLNGGSLRGATILKPETVALMSANQIGNLEAGHMKTTNPGLSSDVDFFPGVRKRWGFGHMITIDPVRDGRKAGSLTWAGLLNTYYWIDPASGIAGVLMTQMLPFADARALKVYRAFEHGLYRAHKAA